MRPAEHVRPWARLIAKWADAIIALPVLIIAFFVFVLVISFSTSLVSPAAAEFWIRISETEISGPAEWVLGLAIMSFFPVIEGVWISAFGAMPGKWLMGIRVRDRETGRKLRMGKSIARSYGAYFWGLGWSIPIVALITQIRSYGYLKHHGATRWDEAQNVGYQTRSVAWFRWTLAVAFVLVCSIMLNAL